MDRKPVLTPKGAVAEDPDKCRSLVCDPSGIIVAEMVYRCMICYYVTDSIADAREHYSGEHMHDGEEEDDEQAGHHQERASGHAESLLYQNQVKLAHHQQQQQLRHASHSSNNPLVPDVSLYESQSPASLKFNTSSPHNNSSYQSSPAPHRPSPSPATNGGSGAKSGYVTCAVCNVTRYYSCVQRRYGQFTCVTCYRYFRTFLLKPKKYACPNLGGCPLNVRTRCRACWIKACITVFSVDARRQQVIQANLPVKKGSGPPKLLAQPAIEYPHNNNNNDENGDHRSESPDSLDQDATPKDMSYGALQMLEPEVSLMEDGDGDEPSSPLSEDMQEAMLAQGMLSGEALKLVVTGKKVWSCGKCQTCTAEDCGKCIYCLDRPKFGGPFIKKQRCIKRRCLMKIKNHKGTLLRTK